MNENKTQTVVFKNPITRGDTQITEVVLREPTAGDLRGLSLHSVLTLETDAIAELVPRISTPNLIKSEIMQLRIADLVELGSALARFLSDTQNQQT